MIDHAAAKAFDVTAGFTQRTIAGGVQSAPVFAHVRGRYFAEESVLRYLSDVEADLAKSQAVTARGDSLP